MVEPVVPENIDQFSFPIGQTKIFIDLLNNSGSRNEIVESLREEYLAIVRSLQELDVSFRIICSDKREVDLVTLRKSLSLGAQIVDFSTFGRNVTIYPRDFLTIINSNTVFLNPRYTKPGPRPKDGLQTILSPFGEGGRILISKNTALVPERIIPDNGQSIKTTSNELTNLGIKVGKISPPVVLRCRPKEGTQYQDFNDHLDRVSVLIRSMDNKPHLIIDPQIQIIRWYGKSENPIWEPLSITESRAEIQQLCDSMKIVLHYPQESTIPYALILEQFPAGRILITGV